MVCEQRRVQLHLLLRLRETSLRLTLTLCSLTLTLCSLTLSLASSLVCWLVLHCVEAQHMRELELLLSHLLHRGAVLQLRLGRVCGVECELERLRAWR